MKVILCNTELLDDVAKLFNHYRMFYKKSDDYDSSYKFIEENFRLSRSLIFVLLNENNQAIGFSQLYPSFCSLEMKPIYYLYDFFVHTDQRRHGYGEYLMNSIIDYFKEKQVARLTLDTAFANKIAQSLYEKIGFNREIDFIAYHYYLNK